MFLTILSMSDCLGMCLQIIDNRVSIGTSAWGVCVYSISAPMCIFAESAPMTSRLGVNPENSRNVQRMTQILHLSHNARANNAKFATFAHKYKISIIFVQVLLHIFCIYAPILHHCRLALNSYKFYC